jgi:excisionase family DNA binding protein
METFFTTKEAAERLGISDSRIRQLILDGNLAVVKAGRGWLIKATDVRLMEKRKTKPRSSGESGKQVLRIIRVRESHRFIIGTALKKIVLISCVSKNLGAHPKPAIHDHLKTGHRE